MAVEGRIVNASGGVVGFDTASNLDSSAVAGFADDGYTFCIRYVGLGSSNESRDLDTAEVNRILDSGLALMAVQHVRSAGWQPTQSLGGEYGENAANNASRAGLPGGINLWCDLEGIGVDQVTDQQVIDYCNAWYSAVSDAGYVPGLYVGSRAKLTGDQLYQQLRFKHYWRSLSSSSPSSIGPRGYQLLQSNGGREYGVPYDENRTRRDGKGGTPIWLIRN